MDEPEAPEYFWVTADLTAAQPVVVARGELDAASSADLLESIDTAAGRGQGLVLDLGEVTFIDSSGLRAITEVLRRSHAEGFEFRVTAMSDAVRRVFDMTSMTPLLAPEPRG
jgi:anti-anti-sigma factor